VGYPNAGKSSILSRISAAKPKIAGYPFTTLSPILGVVRVDDERSFILADIPGLIEGAHSGTGLGDEFLRHISRTRVLIHVIDMASVDGRDPVEDYENINEELFLYDNRLAELPQIIAANKMDLPPAKSGLQKLQQHLAKKEENHRGTEAQSEERRGEEAKGRRGEFPRLRGSLIPVSAATGEGLRQMIYSSFQLLEAAIRSDTDQKIEPQEEILEYKYEPGFIITKEGSKYVLTGKAVRRAVVMTDLENEQAVIMLHKRLKQMGVIRALMGAGAKDGDTVVVDGTELTFMA
jgi:GTP-binding protein